MDSFQLRPARRCFIITQPHRWRDALTYAVFPYLPDVGYYQELINVMADAGVLTVLSVRESAPQYLLLPRKSPYPRLAGRFPLYSELEALAGAEGNHVILTL